MQTAFLPEGDFDLTGDVALASSQARVAVGLGETEAEVADRQGFAHLLIHGFLAGR